VAWSPDGQHIASGGWERDVWLWEANGTRGAILKGHTSCVTCVAWSPDSQRLASSGHDGTVRLWDADGSPGAVLQGHSDSVPSVSWSPDGRRIASSELDGTVRLWGADGSPGGVLEGHKAGIWSAAWSPNSDQIASAGLDGVLILWDAKTAEPQSVILPLNDDESVTFSAAGDILHGDPEVVENKLIYLVETPLGGVEILKPSEFQKRAEAARSLQPPPPAVAPFDEAQAKRHQKEWADHLGVPVEMTNSIGMKLVLIPPGEFEMGSEHQVTLTSPFYVGKHEVTVDQFREFVQDGAYRTEAEKGGRGGSVHNPSTGRREDMRDHSWRVAGYPQDGTHPVVMVTWNDAVAFCSWLSERDAKTYRLPTDAEWEFTCRAGTTTAWTTGQAQESLRGFANLADRSLARESVVKVSTAPWDDGHAYTAPVGTFRPNGFGIHDVVGNVYEWCRDWHAGNYYQRAPRLNPPGPASGSNKVIRGGGWNADRDSLSPIGPGLLTK